MGTAAAAAHHAYTLSVYVLAMTQHPVQEYVAAGCLIDMGTTGVVGVCTDLLLALAPSVEVEIYADGAHTSQRTQSLLFVLAITVGPVTVGADDEGESLPRPLQVEGEIVPFPAPLLLEGLGEYMVPKRC